MKHNRFGKKLTLLLCLLLIAVSVLSFAFILESADHDCIGEDCHTCAQIAFAENILHQLGAGLSVAVVLFAIALLFRSAIVAANAISAEFSLVSLKVKLNN